MCVHVCRTSRKPRTQLACEQPIDEHQLEYEVHGWFKWDGVDAEGVKRLGRQWVPVEQICLLQEWGSEEDEFDTRVRNMRASFA